MSLTAKLSIDNSEFKKGLKDAENQAKNSMNKMSKTTNDANSSLSKMTDTLNNVTTAAKGGLGGVTSVLAKMGPYGAAAAAGISLIGVAIAGILKGVSTLAHGLRDTVKTANSVNMSANAYISLQHACAKAGIEMSKVLMLINKIDYAVIHAEAGEKKYADAFYKLGIVWEDLEKMSPEKRLMAVNDAMKELKESGKSIPKEMFDIFGKRDMQTLNKMQQQKDFNKLIAEAGALGYTIPESMLQAAVRYAEVTDGTAARFKAMIASMKEMEELTNGLADLWKGVSDRIANANGIINKEYRDEFESIVDVAKDLSSSGKLSNDEMIKLLKDKYTTMTKMEKTEGNRNKLSSAGDYLRYINSLSEEEIIKEFNAQMSNLDWGKLNSAFKTQIFKMVEKHDSRFSADNQSSWVQAKEKTPEDKAAKRRRLEISHANTEARALNEQLKRNQQYYDNALTKNQKIIDVDKEILKIEQHLQTILNDKTATIDKELEHQLRLNAALVNQKALESEILKVKKTNEKGYISFYSTMLGGMGANKNIMDQLFEGFKTLNDGKLDLVKGNLIPSLMSEYLKKLNPKEADESDADYKKRIQDLIKNGPSYDSAAEFLILNPDNFWETFQSMAEAFSENEIDIAFDDQQLFVLKKAEEEYNKFAARVKAEPIKINLDFESNSESRNTKNYESIKAALEGFKNQELKESREESWISQARVKRNQLQTKLDSFGKDADPATVRQTHDEFNDIDAQIRQYEAERKRLEILLNNAQNLLGKAKFIDEIKEANEEAYNQEVLSNMFKFRTSKEDTEREIRLLEAQTAKEQDTVDEIQKQNILKKAGIVLTERNLQNYDDVLDDLIQINKQLEEAKNNKILTEKNEASIDNNRLSKNVLLKDWQEVEQLEKINHLRAIGVQITQENLNKYDALLQKLYDQESEQRRLNMISQLQSGTKSAKYSMMELQGQGKRAAVMKATDEAEIALRRSLTTEEKDAVTSLAELQYKLSNWKAPELKDDTVYTNDLAKRGGFNTSVVVEKNDTAKRQLASLMKLESIGQELIKQEQRNNDILNN